VSAERALAGAIRVRAQGDSAVIAVFGAPARFYDEPPPELVFPYATFGRFAVRAADSAAQTALEHSVTLHVWSRYGCRGEALDGVSALRGALHDAPLAVTGYGLVLCVATFADVFRAGDGRTSHGVLRLRAITEPMS